MPHTLTNIISYQIPMWQYCGDLVELKVLRPQNISDKSCPFNTLIYYDIMNITNRSVCERNFPEMCVRGIFQNCVWEEVSRIVCERNFPELCERGIFQNCLRGIFQKCVWEEFSSTVCVCVLRGILAFLMVLYFLDSIWLSRPC